MCNWKSNWLARFPNGSAHLNEYGINHLLLIKLTTDIWLKETSKVSDVKNQIQRLLDIDPDNQQIHDMNSDEELNDTSILQKCGIKGDCAMAYKWVL